MDAVVAAEQAPPTTAATTPPAPNAAPAAAAPATPPLPDTILAGGAVTPPAPAADGKESSTTPAAGAAVAEYELALPEGLEVPADHLENVKAFAKGDAKLAQATLDRDISVWKAARAAQMTAWTEQVATWRSEIEKHPKMGGENFARTVQDARRALAEAPPELHEVLRTSGYGNHPLLVEWAARIGAKMGEAALVTGDQAAKKVRSLADDFPNTPAELGGSKKD